MKKCALIWNAVIVLTLASTSITQSLQEACFTPPLPNSQCGFYIDCLENYYSCGPEGYAIGYGFKYCNKFTSDKMRECVDVAGDEWVNNTLSCLQESLVPVIESDDVNDVSCMSIKLDAFDSHSTCYTGGGGSVPTAPSVCFLPIPDVLCILSTIDKQDLLSPLGLKEDIETAQICVSQHQNAGLCESNDKAFAVDSLSQRQEQCEYWKERLRAAQNLERELGSGE
jgi:hypothetical protein